MMHPYIIDTSVIYNTSGDRKRKTKLARLAAEFLSETIQASKDGHDSIEDSWSALKLVQLKLQKSKYIYNITLEPCICIESFIFCNTYNKMANESAWLLPKLLALCNLPE